MDRFGRIVEQQWLNTATGTASDDFQYTYDRDGNVLSRTDVLNSSLNEQYSYDGLNRLISFTRGTETQSWSLDAAGNWSSFTNSGTTQTRSSSNNNVLEQTEYTYDNDGNILLQTTRERFDNETQGGPLGNPAIHPYARVYYLASYYDAASRLTASANVGTNGGTAYTRPNTVPARSDTVLVTSISYLADAVQQVLLTGSPTGGSFTLSFGGQTTTAIAYNATAATVQSDLQALSSVGSGNILVSGPAGGPWLVRFAGSLAGMPEVEMTGSGSGLTGGSNPAVAVGTTSQGGDTGLVESTTDPLGLVSKTDYDLLGRTVRTIQDFVAFAPSNSADQTTQYSYDGDDNLLTLSAVLPGYVLETTTYSYGVTGSIINSNDLLASVTYPGETQTDSYSYDALGETLTHTDRNGNTHTFSYDILGRQTADAVTTLGPGVDGSVRLLTTAYDTGGRPYLYTSYADTAGTTMVNQVQESYNGFGQLISELQNHRPYQATISYSYAFASNSSRLTTIRDTNNGYYASSFTYNAGVDTAISRVSQISNLSGSFVESLSYLGLNTLVQRSQTLAAGSEPPVNLTYVIPGGNPDGGDQYTGLDRFGRIVEQQWLNTATGTATDDITYTYDRDSNVLTRNNLADSSDNEQYSYDGLNRLTSFTRGTERQSWSLDAAGNWSSFTNSGATQTRSSNLQNQITSISGATTPSYDNNGNTLTDDQGTVYTFDAWDRMVKAVTTGGSTELDSYDALGRRITTTLNGQPTHFYYSSSGQVLEEIQYLTGGQSVTENIWSPAYVDALFARIINGTAYTVQQDADWNVTAVAKSVFNFKTGQYNLQVQERFVFDPYGQPTAAPFLNMPYLFQGGRYDTTTGLYQFGARNYSPTLGRWMEQDPIGYAGGDNNLYGFLADNPVMARDPNGLTMVAPTGPQLPEAAQLPEAGLNLGFRGPGGIVIRPEIPPLVVPKELRQALSDSLFGLDGAIVGPPVSLDFNAGILGEPIYPPPDIKVLIFPFVLPLGPGAIPAPTCRAGLRNGMGEPPPEMINPNAHHELPWSLREWFAHRGFNVNDPQFGRWVEGTPPGVHQVWSNAYQNAWEQFIESNPNASKDQILNYLNSLRSDPRFQ